MNTIYKTNKICKEHLIVITLILFFVPLVFATVGGLAIYTHSIQIYGGEYKATKAVIKDIKCYKDKNNEKDCNAYVSYYVNGREYQNLYPFYSDGMKIGTIKEIFYNKTDPSLITTKSLINMGIILIIGSSLFILIFSFKLKNFIKNEKKRKKLFKTGKEIYVDVIKIVEDTSIEINKKSPYMAFCNYTDEDGNIYEMFSESTMERLDKYLKQKNGELKLKAYVDPNNLNEYVIPIDYLFET